MLCLCARDCIKCSCPEMQTCSMYRSECLHREGPKEGHSLRDVGNISPRWLLPVCKVKWWGRLQKDVIQHPALYTVGLKSFHNWKKARKAGYEETCQNDLMEHTHPTDFVSWLLLFAADVRYSKENQFKYSNNNLHLISRPSVKCMYVWGQWIHLHTTFGQNGSASEALAEQVR